MTNTQAALLYFSFGLSIFLGLLLILCFRSLSNLQYRLDLQYLNQCRMKELQDQHDSSLYNIVKSVHELQKVIVPDHKMAPMGGPNTNAVKPGVRQAHRLRRITEVGDE